MEEGRHGLGVAVEATGPGEEVIRVGEQHFGVGGEELVLVGGDKFCGESGVVRGLRIQNYGPSENVGVTAEGLG